MRALAGSIAAGFGATAELDFREVTVPVVNGAAETKLIADAAAALVGEVQVDRERLPGHGLGGFLLHAGRAAGRLYPGRQRRGRGRRLRGAQPALRFQRRRHPLWGRHPGSGGGAGAGWTLAG